MASRLKELYDTKIRAELKKQLGYTNEMQLPKLEKIVLNMGVGEAATDKKKLESAVKDMTAIAGQKVVITKAKKSLANFKLKEGMPIGCKVTLRRDRMYDFLDRLVNVAMPRIRDFRGLNGKSFDGKGNYAFGIKEQIIFPEIDFDKIDNIRGMDIIICTTANNDKDAKALLAAFNFPFYIMSKVSLIERNKKRIKMSKSLGSKRQKLLDVARDRNAKPEDIFEANLKLAKLPRNSSVVRVRNRCALSGRPRGYYRKFDISRIALRELASEGKLPGVRKSSW